jgi:hypothetical protein
MTILEKTPYLQQAIESDPETQYRIGKGESIEEIIIGLISDKRTYKESAEAWREHRYGPKIDAPIRRDANGRCYPGISIEMIDNSSWWSIADGNGLVKSFDLDQTLIDVTTELAKLNQLDLSLRSSEMIGYFDVVSPIISTVADNMGLKLGPPEGLKTMPECGCVTVFPTPEEVEGAICRGAFHSACLEEKARGNLPPDDQFWHSWGVDTPVHLKDLMAENPTMATTLHIVVAEVATSVYIEMDVFNGGSSGIGVYHVIPVGTDTIVENIAKENSIDNTDAKALLDVHVALCSSDRLKPGTIQESVQRISINVLTRLYTEVIRCINRWKEFGGNAPKTVIVHGCYDSEFWHYFESKFDKSMTVCSRSEMAAAGITTNNMTAGTPFDEDLSLGATTPFVGPTPEVRDGDGFNGAVQDRSFEKRTMGPIGLEEYRSKLTEKKD